MARYLAEFLGTLILVLFGCGAAVLGGEQVGQLGIALAFGLAIVALAYGLNDPSNFAGVKGYESYAARSGGATAPDAQAASQNESKPAPKGYDQSNLMIGTPEMIIEKIIESQEACSFSEITLMPQFGTMPYEAAAESVKLFAREVLPVVHKMDAPLHASALPEVATSEL